MYPGCICQVHLLNKYVTRTLERLRMNFWFLAAGKTPPVVKWYSAWTCINLRSGIRDPGGVGMLTAWIDARSSRTETSNINWKPLGVHAGNACDVNALSALKTTGNESNAVQTPQMLPPPLQTQHHQCTLKPHAKSKKPKHPFPFLLPG